MRVIYKLREAGTPLYELDAIAIRIQREGEAAHRPILGPFSERDPCRFEARARLVKPRHEESNVSESAELSSPQIFVVSIVV